MECRTKLNQGDVHCHTEIARQEPMKVFPSKAGGLFWTGCTLHQFCCITVAPVWVRGICKTNTYQEVSLLVDEKTAVIYIKNMTKITLLINVKEIWFIHRIWFMEIINYSDMYIFSGYVIIDHFSKVSSVEEVKPFRPRQQAESNSLLSGAASPLPWENSSGERNLCQPRGGNLQCRETQ